MFPAQHNAWRKQFCGGSVLIAARKLMQRVPAVPLDFNCLYFFEYTGLPPADGFFGNGRTGLEVRGGTPEDLEGLVRCQNSRQAFLNRFRWSDHCVVAEEAGRIVGYQWFCSRPIHLEERYAYRVEIPADAVYTYDAFILPEYRLTGIWLRFHSWYLRSLMERLHKTRILTSIDRGNRLSINTHLRFGYQPVRRVLVTRVCGRSFFLTKPLSRMQDASPASEPSFDEQEPRGIQPSGASRMSSFSALRSRSEPR
jgi:GNAT superfamily N-acetyltransferase